VAAKIGRHRLEIGKCALRCNEAKLHQAAYRSRCERQQIANLIRKRLFEERAVPRNAKGARRDGLSSIRRLSRGRWGYDGGLTGFVDSSGFPAFVAGLHLNGFARLQAPSCEVQFLQKAD